MGVNILDESNCQIDNANSPLHYTERNDEIDSEEYIEFMEFRLIYEGSLKANNSGGSRVAEKHSIRQQIHKQLDVLWTQHPNLNWKRTGIIDKPAGYVEQMQRKGKLFNDPNATSVETLARRFDKCGFRFVPLVNKAFELVCGLDILFLRRDNPGNLILQGGDVDNRIKTLIDALRVPTDCSELPKGCVPEHNENPFFCLLENDSLVTELHVTTDRLLIPLRHDESANNVHLLIRVKVKAAKFSAFNMELV